MTGIYALGGANLLVSLYSLMSSFRYAKYLHSHKDRAPGRSALPPVTLLVPCCGLDMGLADNLRAIVRQDYPDLRVIFIVENENDPAVPVIRSVMTGEKRATRLLAAGSARARGQKVHNLLTAVATIEDECVLAFADSDIRPAPDWLVHLVEPLERGDVGAATGYRFYVPERDNFASLLRSLWNAGVLTLLGDHNHNFAWGGSMALKRSIFRQAKVEDAWQGVLSDDYALTHAVRRAGFRVEFVPRCLVASVGTVDLGEVGDWCTRQMAITRVYWPNLWRIAGGSQILYSLFLVVGSLAVASGDTIVGGMLAAVLAAGALTGALRARAIQQIGPEWKRCLSGFTLAYALCVPLVGLLTAYGFIRSLLSRRIQWRGKTYEMKSRTETLIIE